MPRPIDPDTLRIPAFMRKRSIRSRLTKPLLLTALDRKQAGIPPEGTKKRSVAKKSTTVRELKSKLQSKLHQNAFAFEQRRPAATKKTRARKIKPLAPVVASPIFEAPIFQAPILDSMPTARTRTLKPKKITKAKAVKAQRQKSNKVGVVSHYYGKIQVAVFALSATLSVGDCITYQTESGDEYRQVVESMEIDRRPVFSAGRGKEVGIKVEQPARVGTSIIVE